jgi:[protein-PII] uridylyltransferase
VTELEVLAPPAPAEVYKSLAARTAEVEDQVRGAYESTLKLRFPSGVALAAVGGFGRRELFANSDVDLMILVDSTELAQQGKDALSAFLQMLWDANLRPSHSVHTIADCGTEHAENGELTISLLDRRLLIGDSVLFEGLDKKFREFILKRGTAIARQLAGLAEARRAGFQNTIYHLEPNIKDTPGGLRDLQGIRWFASLRPGPASIEERPGLRPAFEFLSAVRIRLHEMARRDQNILSFDAQERMSEQPGALMRDYYRHARLVDRYARRALAQALEQPGSLLGRFQDWRSRLSTSEFTVSRDQVLLRQPHHLPRNLGLFEFVARHGLRLAPDTLERLSSYAPEADWNDWKRLLSLPRAALGLRAMQEAGALGVALPEWRHIECLVVRDFYHRYTVDEHTLVAISSLESLTDKRMAALFEEIENPAVLRFALLMHDIGKGSGHEHVGESLKISRVVMQRIGVSEAEQADIEFLIDRHLDLSTVMTSRDLTDESTARNLADRVGTIERLKMLAMLTYADISAVNPQAMTPWRMEQLWRVYLLAHAELTRELETSRIHEASGLPPEQAAFLEGLPTRYLRSHTPTEIAGHLALAAQLESRPVAIEITHDRGVHRLTLLTRDRPGLFAGVAGAISSFGLNIVKVEAFSNAAGVVVDTFTFADPHKTLELNPPEVDRLRGIVRKVAEGKQDADKLLRGRPKPLLPSRGGRLKPSVVFNNDSSEAATLIEIVAQDRAGLLFDLARAISATGCNIEVVLIDTEAHKALDVFYVTANGRKLEPETQARLKEALVGACLGS